MKPLIFATLVMFWCVPPVLAQSQPSSAATAQTDLNSQGSLAGIHATQTDGGDKDNPTPHIYKRGEHISRSYGAFDEVKDWSRFKLMKPPADSHWVKYGENYLLVKTESGLITDIVKA